MKTETWVRLAAIGVAVLSAALIGYAALRLLSGILWPFAAAALAASLLRPAAGRLRARTHLPQKAGGTVLILSAVLVLSWLAFVLARMLYDGAASFIAQLTAQLDDPSSPLSDVFRSGVFFLADARWQHLAGILTDLLREAAASASAALTSLAGGWLMELPRAALALVVGLVALFILFFDAERLSGQVRAFFGDAFTDRLAAVTGRIRRTLSACVRAYLLLLLLTFGEVLIGFLLLRVAHPVRAAALTAVVDLLPVLGVGTVLLPWSLLLFLSGELGRGAGMAALLVVIVIVRQYAEPRILGSSLGIHPLWMLIAVYAGLRLCGLGGVLLAPLALLTVRAVVDGIRGETGETAGRDFLKESPSPDPASKTF